MSLTRDEALEEIGANIAWWLRFTRESHEREGIALSRDTHIIPPCWPSYEQLCNWLDYLAPALATEARRAGTVEQGPVHDGAGRDSDNAQTTDGASHD